MVLSTGLFDNLKQQEAVWLCHHLLLNMTYPFYSSLQLLDNLV